MTDERIKDRADWIHEGLLWWLRSIHGVQTQWYRNAAANASQIQRLEHHWVNLGNQIWERAELSLYQNAPNVNNWTNVREFQRDIMTWVKVWHDCIYRVAGAPIVRMSSLLDTLITTLHGFGGVTEVAVADPNDELIHIWIRLKNYPSGYACLISLPKLTDNAF